MEISEANAAEWVSNFRQGNCPEFPHEAHLLVGWQLLRELPLARAIEVFAEGVKELSARKGQADAYHETVTWAFMILIHQRLRQQETAAGADWNSFRANNQDLFVDGKRLMQTLYRQETLQSDLAKRLFLFPDGKWERDHSPNSPASESESR